MAEATFRHGDACHIDYTPSTGNVSAGQVVLLGNTAGLCLGIADRDIENNVKGELAFGGFWRVLNLNNAANYAKVWWDDTNNKATTVSTNNALLGFIAEEGGGGANTNCTVFVWPLV